MSDETTQAAGVTADASGTQAGATGAATTGAAAPAAAPAAAAPAASTSQQAPAGQTAAAPAAAASAPGQSGAPAPALKPAQGAPEKYEFKAPEGLALGEAVIAKFSTVARDANMSQEAAQKVLNEIAPALAQDNVKAIVSAMDKATATWADAAQSDKEYGGEKFKENLAVVGKAFDRFATPELRALMNRYDPKTNTAGTGLGNHPEMLRMFYRIGKAISEDKIVPSGGQPPAGGRDAATVLYGTTKPKA